MPVKRKARSKSSKDSTPSPDDKKMRTEASSVSSQTDDEVFEALNMAEDLGKKIEHVLLKLGKLDIIESHLQDINSTLANIEQNVSRLDEEVLKPMIRSKLSRYSRKIWNSVRMTYVI